MSNAAPDAASGVPLVLTAMMEPAAFERFQALRRAAYPPERNLVPAQVTLFHHLPPAALPDLADRLKALCQGTPTPVARVEGLRSLGRGVAFRLSSPELEGVRAELAHAWATLLVPQDRAGFQPHVTVQNKVEPALARALLEQLSADFRPWRFRMPALQLWRYLGGPWEPVRRFPFAGRRA